MLGAALYLVLVGIINALMQRQDRTNTMYTEQMQMWKVGVEGPCLCNTWGLYDTNYNYSKKTAVHNPQHCPL